MRTTKQSVDYDCSLVQARTVCHAVHGDAGSFGLLFMCRDPVSLRCWFNPVTKLPQRLLKRVKHEPDK
jgi:hypothetical protein